MHRRRLPLLDPCRSPDPPENSAFCTACEKQVHDLSAMTEAQARRFLRRHAGERMCVRYVTNVSGTVRFRATPPVLGAIAFLFAVSGCAALGLDQQWCFEHDGDAYACEADRTFRVEGKGPPAFRSSEPLTGGGQRYRVDFSIDPLAERRFVGMIIADPDRAHYDRYPDRLTYEPTVKLWRDLRRSLHERSERRRRRRR